MSSLSVLSRDPIFPKKLYYLRLKLHHTARCVSQEITTLQTSYLVLSVSPMILSLPRNRSKARLCLNASHYTTRVISHPFQLLCLHFVVEKCQKIV